MFWPKVKGGRGGVEGGGFVFGLGGYGAEALFGVDGVTGDAGVGDTGCDGKVGR